ncbi:uncharacterized protein BDR25DRAFT_303872 [Lindgomyces ingoldianus]|uniref:Uncharacterized protein n=1 Tax=Lindgomyces ingoldianus TaxID=673940 RepID=A0ACB6QW88_9PLEO|nr:uncharacterized protein BDR25DRAFT_303872 [Lindgomyces ingoldianus]KAF2470345.1 hypothetical protein BDR25DRAFT_303872 [Lindgomyces ingoldianus]
MSSTRISKHYHRLLTLWPKDPLRPNLPFTKTLEHRVARFAPVSSPSPSSLPPHPRASESRTPAPSASAKSELVDINAVYSLLENRYKNRYPVSPGLLKPVSNPEYYDRLMAEIEKAPTKSWLRAKLDEWKMKVRWQ